VLAKCNEGNNGSNTQTRDEVVILNNDGVETFQKVTQEECGDGTMKQTLGTCIKIRM
jgi:hypothetical protein